MDIKNIITYTPCKITVNLNNPEYKYFYLMKFFHKNKNSIIDFLEKIKFDNFYYKNKSNTFTYSATGKNNILYVYKKKKKRNRQNKKNR